MFTKWWIKPLAYVLLFLAVSGGGWFAYSHWVHNIKQEQIKDDKNAQLEQMAKDIQDLKKKTDALDDANTAILVELNKKNTEARDTHDRVSSYINSPEAKKSDRESSEVLKETIRRLHDAQ